MRMTLAVAVACLTLSGLAAAGDATAAIRKETHIPTEGLGPALTKLAKEFDFQVLYRTEIVSDLKSPGAMGALTSDEALGKVLTGTGLTYKYLDDKTVTIIPLSTGQTTAANTSVSPDAANTSKEAGKKTSQEFRVAQMDQGHSSSTSPIANQPPISQERSNSPSAGLAEIVVTAQKREERSLDVPMSISVLSGDQLVRSQSYRLEDYIGTVPSLTYVDGIFGPTGSALVIRGITTGHLPIHSAVATYIDETPYVAAGSVSPFIVPNLDTFDMQRIEVLKGPQGTLYGASALGGLFKYVTNAPDPSRLAVAGDASVSSVSHGGTGFDVHGMVNLPISNSVALRLVGYDNYYPGFIDDPSRGLQDINGSRFSGGRVSLLLKPTDDLSIRASALYQNRSWSDAANEYVYSGSLVPVRGNLTVENRMGQPGHTSNGIYNLTIDWDAGLAQLLSTTTYFTFRQSVVMDYSTILGAAVRGIAGSQYGAAIWDSRPANSWTQEVRLSSPNNTVLQWQVGGFYTSTDTIRAEQILPIDPVSHAVLYNYPTNIGDFPDTTNDREVAGYVSLDYHITPTLDIAAGGRYSSYDETYSGLSTGIFGTNLLNTGSLSGENVFTYSADVRGHFTPENMLYVRVASGYVPGGVVGRTAVTPATIPNSYGPSKTVNYEAGIKNSLIDGRLNVELSAFDIEWHDLQFNTVVGGFGVKSTSGAARSTGAEWNVTYAPITGLSLGFNGSYTDAHLIQATSPVVGGKVGDRLPTVPLWQTSASARYEYPISSGLSGFGGVDWRFSGKRAADFEATLPRQWMPSFNFVDLRAGVSSDAWTFTLYAKNVGNKTGINYLVDWGAIGGNPIQSASVYTSRTIGAEVSVHF